MSVFFYCSLFIYLFPFYSNIYSFYFQGLTNLDIDAIQYIA